MMQNGIFQYYIHESKVIYEIRPQQQAQKSIQRSIVR